MKYVQKNKNKIKVGTVMRTGLALSQKGHCTDHRRLTVLNYHVGTHLF